uniref:DNA2/NAM7 helicase helicase domain-containing protein n=1 Tax=Callorhinchus milii TaxID=7868 RepID=A0A4W3JYX7_CALMI
MLRFDLFAYRYNQLVHEAQVNEIKNHNIILCTCTTAARPLIKENTNFFQCIVDDSEACTEPECLIPIVSSNAKQVVLIGDHKQSRPDVKSELAKNLGLGMSIFERYVSDALMLNVQYQMVCKGFTFTMIILRYLHKISNVYLKTHNSKYYEQKCFMAISKIRMIQQILLKF